MYWGARLTTISKPLDTRKKIMNFTLPPFLSPGLLTQQNMPMFHQSLITSGVLTLIIQTWSPTVFVIFVRYIFILYLFIFSHLGKSKNRT